MEIFHTFRLFLLRATMIMLAMAFVPDATGKTDAAAKPCEIKFEIHGPTLVCKGQTYTYTIELTYPQPGPVPDCDLPPDIANYFSGSLQVPLGTIGNINTANASFDITWNNTGTDVLSIVYAYNGVVVQKDLQIEVQEAIPAITSNSEVSCQAVVGEGTSNEIVDDGSPCIKVCEYAQVIYKAKSANSGSSFTWKIAGGNFNNPNGPTTITGNTATAYWDGTGTGYIELTETTTAGCVGKKTICVEIIESPVADFSSDRSPSIGMGACDDPEHSWEICFNQTITFYDGSSASTSSPIVFWQWDFGDGSPYSAQQNPAHTYITQGTYQVTLTVTNACGCKSTMQGCVFVYDKEGPKITCPSVACENTIGSYTTEASCNPDYQWSVLGGQIVDDQGNPTSPPYSNHIFVLWDKVDDSGFGTVTLDATNCNGPCALPTSISVPVVKTQGTITGAQATCVGSFYKYSLPAWPATNYTWTITNNATGATITSSSYNSHEIQVLSGSGFGQYIIKCTYSNTLLSCAGSATLKVNNVPGAVIKAPLKSCRNSAITCTVQLTPSVAVNGITTWRVKSPAGSIVYQTTTTNTNMVTLPGTVFNTAGSYNIFASNSTSFCPPDPVRVDILAPPAQPPAIAGLAQVCPTYPYQYSVPPSSNALINYVWEASQNGTVFATGIGNTFSVAWPAGANKVLTVYAEWLGVPGCRSVARTLAITNIVPSGTFNGLATVCVNSQTSYSYNYTQGEAYEWSLANPQHGSIISGQGGTGVSIQWNNVPSTVTDTLVCKVTKCGVVYTFNYPIQLTSSPVFSIVAASPVCEGSPASFSVSSVPAATITGIAWNLGDGTTSTAIAPSHVYAIPPGSPVNFPVNATITHTGCNVSGTPLINTVNTSITVDPAPDINLTCPDGLTQTKCIAGGNPPVSNYILTVSTSSVNPTIQWFKNGVPMGLSTNPLPVSSAGVPPYTNTVYFAEVTETAPGSSQNCTSRSNTFSINYTSNCASGPCTPVAPSGWIGSPSHTLNKLSCDSGKAKVQINLGMTVAGTLGGNIQSFNWRMPPAPGFVSQSGTGSLTASPQYTFDKPGQYSFCFEVYYKDTAQANTDPCLKSYCGSITIPHVTEFTAKLTCNGTNNGYTLTLQDHTSFHTPVTQWRWYVNNMVTPVSTAANFNYGAIAPGTHTIKLVTSDGSWTCEETQTLTVTNPPVAAFNMSTTDAHAANPFKHTCEDKPVTLTSTSTPAANIIKYSWNFGDGTSSLLTNPRKAYLENADINRMITLTVTDKYGCTAQASQTVSVFNRNQTIGYTPLAQTICSNSTTGIQATLSGTSPLSYNWFKENTPIGGGGATLNNINASGAYWLRLTDIHACIYNGNPTPAKVTVVTPPPAVIDGKHHVCIDDGDIELQALTIGASPGTYYYEWHRDDGNGPVPVGYDTLLTDVGLPVGTYNYTLYQTFDPGNGNPQCTVTSAPFTVQIHDIPVPPVAGFTALDCSKYEIRLSATHPLPNATFTWSSGGSGTPISVYNGGAYRVWVTDQYGCKNHDDIDVPLAPSSYFWRFPQGACYSFCAADLPKHIDGPAGVPFDSWEWLINGTTVNPNGPYPGSGTNSVVAPLWLDLPPNGSGPGMYQWRLDNGLCSQVSEPMNIDMAEDCCELDFNIETVYCESPSQSMYHVTLYGNTPSGGIYNVYVRDANGNAIGSFIPASGGISSGGYSFNLQMQLYQYSTPIVICLEIINQEGNKCTSCRSVNIQPCHPSDDQGRPGVNTPPSPSLTHEKGLLQDRQQEEIKAYPNPFTHKVKVDIPQRFAGGRIVLYNALSQVIFEGKINAPNETIDLQHLPAGLYIVECIKGKERSRQKITKL